MVQGILADEPDYFLVEARVKPTNNIKLFLDGDHGITIEKCVQINRALYKKMEGENFFPDGDFSLEVSSPGLDEHGIVIEETVGKKPVHGRQGKKPELVNFSYLFNNIKSTKIQVVF